jgi:condensin-2 complex subunit G2
MTGHILFSLFDFIPVRARQILVSTLVSTLSRDKSSVDVRCAVMQAVAKILENPLSHPLLKEMLSELSHAIHDVSEKVRTHFVNILLAVKSIKGIKFYDIVDIDNLLAQLDVEKGTKLTKQLTELILDTFFPYGKKSSKQLMRRCLHLVRSNPNAAKKFYTMVVKFVSSLLPSASR